MKTPERATGDEAEERALTFLLGKGMRLAKRNFLCRGGELDLILWDGDCLVFVEVRQRAAGALCSALESITPGKVKRMTRAAQVYLAGFERMPPCRFDIVAFDGERMTYLPNVIET